MLNARWLAYDTIGRHWNLSGQVLTRDSLVCREMFSKGILRPCLPTLSLYSSVASWYPLPCHSLKLREPNSHGLKTSEIRSLFLIKLFVLGILSSAKCYRIKNEKRHTTKSNSYWSESHKAQKTINQPRIPEEFVYLIKCILLQCLQFNTG